MGWGERRCDEMELNEMGLDEVGWGGLTFAF